MTRYFYISIFALFLSLQLKAQDSLIAGLARQVVKDQVDPKWRYFYLVDSSFTLNIDKFRLRDVKKEISKKHPHFPFNDDSDIVDSTTIIWCNYSLENAKCVSYENLPKFPGYSWRLDILVPYNKYKDEKVLDSLNNLKRNVLYVPIKWYYTRRRINKETEKAWKRYESKFEAEQRDFIELSTPVFSEDKKYALISVRGLGHRSSFVYQMKNGKWVLIFEFDRRIS